MLNLNKLLLAMLIGVSFGCIYAMDERLLQAATDGDLEQVQELLRAGADANSVDHYGDTALILAAKMGNLGVVPLLLDNGANAKAANGFGNTALIWAAYGGHAKIVELLLDKGAMVNAVNAKKGNTALMWATINDHAEVVQLLLDNGADVSVRNNDGETAAMLAKNAEIRAMLELAAMQQERWSPERSEWIKLVDRAANPGRATSGGASASAADTVTDD